MFTKPIFGLDISDHSIEALILNKAFFSRPKVAAYSRVILRGEIIKDGVIKKPDKLAASILELLRSAKPGPITSPYCIFSLPQSQIFSTLITLPAGVPKKELHNTIAYEVKDSLPFKSSAAYFDFKTVSISKKMQEIFYVGVPAKVVDGYLEVLRQIGLQPLVLDVESMSLARGVMSQTHLSKQPVLVMDIGARTTDLTIANRDGVSAQDVVKIAGGRFTKAISVALKVSEKQANDLKIKGGVDDQKQDKKVAVVLQKEIIKITEQTKKFITQYQKGTKQSVASVILVGGSALMPRLDEILQKSLGLPVAIGNPFVNITDPSLLTNLKNKGVLFANVAGLALRGMSNDPIFGSINLLPTTRQKFGLAPAPHQQKRWKLMYIRFIVFLLLLILLAGLVLYRRAGHDPYQQIFTSPQYQNQINTQINSTLLDTLRYDLAHPATTTPTSTPTSTPAVNSVLFTIKIKPNSIGFLNVRSKPSTGGDNLGRALPGSTYPVYEQQGDWLRILWQGQSNGWVNGLYVEKLPAEL